MLGLWDDDKGKQKEYFSTGIENLLRKWNGRMLEYKNKNRYKQILKEQRHNQTSFRWYKKYEQVERIGKVRHTKEQPEISIKFQFQIIFTLH